MSENTENLIYLVEGCLTLKMVLLLDSNKDLFCLGDQKAIESILSGDRQLTTASVLYFNYKLCNFRDKGQLLWQD